MDAENRQVVAGQTADKINTCIDTNRLIITPLMSSQNFKILNKFTGFETIESRICLNYLALISLTEDFMLFYTL